MVNRTIILPQPCTLVKRYSVGFAKSFRCVFVLAPIPPINRGSPYKMKILYGWGFLFLLPRLFPPAHSRICILYNCLYSALTWTYSFFILAHTANPLQPLGKFLQCEAGYSTCESRDSLNICTALCSTRRVSPTRLRARGKRRALLPQFCLPLFLIIPYGARVPKLPDLAFCTLPFSVLARLRSYGLFGFAVSAEREVTAYEIKIQLQGYHEFLGRVFGA